MYGFVQKGTDKKKLFRKRYRVAEDLKSPLENVMTRCFHPHLIIEEDGQLWCYTNASADVFHKLVLRARCEKESRENDVCYMTYGEYMDLGYRMAFMDFIEDNSSRIFVAKDHAMLKAQF